MVLSKGRKMKFILSLFVILSTSVFAQYTPRVDVGLGLQKVGDSVDVLVKSSGYLHKGSGSYFEKYYILTFKGEGALNSGELTSVKLEVSLIKGDIIHDNVGSSKSYAGFSFLDYKYSKNIDINEGGTHTLNIVGIRAGGETSLDGTGNIKLFAKAALSFGGIFQKATRISDGQGMSGRGINSALSYNIEAGLKAKVFKDKLLTATIGMNGHTALGNGEWIYSHTECSEYYDEYYDEFYVACDDKYSLDFDEFHRFKEMFVSLSMQISSRATIFAKAAKRSFSVKDQTGVIPGSKNSAAYYQIGVKYRFGGKKKQKLPKNL